MYRESLGGQVVERFGISVALLTPFNEKSGIDTGLLVGHVNGLLANGADGVTLYGTTGEGASIGLDERDRGIAALANAGVPAERITLGICATSVGDAVAQVEQGLKHGVSMFLLLPPFYFKGCSDEGLFAWHASVFAKTDLKARFILYHIPQVTGVPLSLNLVTRLAVVFPDRIRAIKDSSGSWENAENLLRLKNLTVLVGDERLLHRAAAIGAGGAITGMANLYPERMQRLFTTATEDRALSEEVTRIVSVPVVPALKAVIATRSGDPAWERLLPPLDPLDVASREMVLAPGEQVA